MFQICYFSKSLLYVIKKRECYTYHVAGRRSASDGGESSKWTYVIYICPFYILKMGGREGLTSVIYYWSLNLTIITTTSKLCGFHKCWQMKYKIEISLFSPTLWFSNHMSTKPRIYLCAGHANLGPSINVNSTVSLPWYGTAHCVCDPHS